MKRLRRLFSFLCILLLTACLLPVAAGGEEAEPVAGDANRDGVVDGLDVIRLMKYLAGEKDADTGLPVTVDLYCADVNADEKVDEKDLLRLVRYLAGENVKLEKRPGPVIVISEETTTENIPFETKYEDDPSIFVGNEKIVQEGKAGIRTIVWKVTTANGVETSREKKSEKVTLEPVNRILRRGTRLHVTETREVSEESEEPFETEYENDDTRYETDEEIVKREGVNGVRKKTYSVTYRDDVETSRTLLSDTVTKAPVSRIMIRGTKKDDRIRKTVTVTEEIPYETEEREKPTLEIGHRIVGQEGINGKKEIVYTVFYSKDGEELSRKKVSETVTEQPKKEIVFVGTGTSTYDYEYADIDLSPYMKGTRSAELDEKCKAQAMKMATNHEVMHSGNTGIESVGGDASMNVARIAAHGGEALIWAEYWGAGCVKVTKHTPSGATITGYYMCAQGGGGEAPGYYEKGNPGYDQITH